MSKVEITKPFGKWLINGKSYEELDWIEKVFCDEFLLAMRMEFESKNLQQN